MKAKIFPPEIEFRPPNRKTLPTACKYPRIVLRFTVS